MRGLGWIVILLGLLGAGYLVAQDLGVLQGRREGRAVLEPLERAKEAARGVQDAEDALKKALEKVQKE
ncbi:hypothetical protein [Deferrisoma camini]|uniref:hypothetical protein n=1 Tax=Deferrisoma camini TaxID=1035120 RepID=UPI00046D8D04|nr:hypothetical protein [Deferrisoma camini]